MPISRKVFAQAIKIIKGTANNMAPDIALPRSEQARLYNNAKRRALRLLKKELDTSLPEKTIR